MEEEEEEAAVEEELVRDYERYYRRRAAEGRLVACEEAALKARARWQLRRRRGKGGSLGLRGPVRPGLLAALRRLELLCVNLLLQPWRPEIRTVKTFTGNFVYYIQSVLPDDIVKTVLEKIGYVATTATEFSLVKKRNYEETKQTAFEIFLARIECETILQMTDEENHGSLEKAVQKKAQMHQHYGDKDEGDLTAQREDAGNLENEENCETSSCLATQQKGSTNSDMSFEAAGNWKIKDDIPQLEAAQPSNRLGEHQRQVSNTVHFPGKCSDSEDFLIKYSDIVIRQTPIFSENLSPKALEKKPRADLSEECALAVTAESTANEIRPVPLSPGASGPPAFAIFADTSSDSRTTLEYKAQKVPEESIEAEINDAINCIDPDPTDEPSELKSLPYKDVPSVPNCSIPREEVGELSLAFTELQIKDTEEDLMYPVEETGQPESIPYASTHDRNVGEFNHSKIKQTHLTNAQMQNRVAAHIEPSSDLCCAAGNTGDPTPHSDRERLLVDTPNPHAASEGFRHIREPPNITYVPPQSIDVHSTHLRRTSTRRRRKLLHPEQDSSESSEVKVENYHSKVNEIQEPYVIVDKTQQGSLLCHHS